MSASSVRWRNGEHGYGLITKGLHRLVAGSIVAQFVVGYLLDVGVSGGSWSTGPNACCTC